MMVGLLSMTSKECGIVRFSWIIRLRSLLFSHSPRGWDSLFTRILWLDVFSGY